MDNIPNRSILEKKLTAEDPEIVELLKNPDVRKLLWILYTTSRHYVNDRKDFSELSNELGESIKITVKSAGPATRRFFQIIQVGLDEDDNPKVDAGARIVTKKVIKIVLSMAKGA